MSYPPTSAAPAALDVSGTRFPDNDAFAAAHHTRLIHVGTRVPDQNTLAVRRGISNTVLFERLIPQPNLRSTAYERFTKTFLDIVHGRIAAIGSAGDVPAELCVLSIDDETIPQQEAAL
ncbi:hypothetical protein [Rhodococcus koreensis]|uniref:hypothetical protein n=1 Tax=Rhodococcus koreensis TaxID=99653 RepID=UPI00366C65B4